MGQSGVFWNRYPRVFHSDCLRCGSYSAACLVARRPRVLRVGGSTMAAIRPGPLFTGGAGSGAAGLGSAGAAAIGVLRGRPGPRFTAGVVEALGAGSASAVFGCSATGAGWGGVGSATLTEPAERRTMAPPTSSSSNWWPVDSPSFFRTAMGKAIQPSLFRRTSGMRRLYSFAAQEGVVSSVEPEAANNKDGIPAQGVDRHSPSDYGRHAYSGETLRK
jgi:hypothetical protein